MKYSLIILTFLISIAASGEPWDKMLLELTSSKTLGEIKQVRSKFYSRMDYSPLTRTMDFGYENTVWEFDFINGAYSTNFKLSIISRNDSIVFGKIEQLHWRGNTEEISRFSVIERELENLVNSHNTFYSTNYKVVEFIDELMEDHYFSLGCGETGSDYPIESVKMQDWAKSNNIKKLRKWLTSPNFELQAYAVAGLSRIEETGSPIPEELTAIIEHLRNRNSAIINCSGCLMGLETPINQLLFDHRDSN